MNSESGTEWEEASCEEIEEEENGDKEMENNETSESSE